MRIETYLFFPGNADEAMSFYREVFGGTLEITRRGDLDPGASAEDRNLIINAELRGDGFVLRAADRIDGTLEPQSRIELTLVSTDEDALRRVFDRLSETGSGIMALERQFWGDLFGTVTDRFGIRWQLDVPAESDDSN